MAASPDRPSGLRVASVGGVPVYVGSSWLILAVVVIALVGPGIAADRPDLGALAYGVGALYAVGLLVAVLVHEAAHAVVARGVGHRVHAVVADIWGGHTTYDPSRGTPGSAAAIAVVGPLSNLVLGLLAWGVHPFVPEGVPSGLLGAFAFVNVLLAAFNLLPGLPLDGGQLVEAAVWRLTGSRPRGRVVAGWCGRAVVVVVVVWALGLPLLSGARPDLFRVVWTVLICAFLWQGATAAIAAGQSLGVLARLDPARVIRPARAVSERAVLADVDPRAAHGVPVVVDALGRPLALLSAAAMDGVPEELRDRTPVSAVMARQPSEWVVPLEGDPEEDLIALVRTFQDTRASHLAVTRGGVLAGVVSVHELGAALDEVQGRPPRP